MGRRPWPCSRSGGRYGSDFLSHDPGPCGCDAAASAAPLLPPPLPAPTQAACGKRPAPIPLAAWRALDTVKDAPSLSGPDRLRVPPHKVVHHHTKTRSSVSRQRLAAVCLSEISMHTTQLPRAKSCERQGRVDSGLFSLLGSRPSSRSSQRRRHAKPARGAASHSACDQRNMVDRVGAGRHVHIGSLDGLRALVREGGADRRAGPEASPFARLTWPLSSVYGAPRLYRLPLRTAPSQGVAMPSTRRRGRSSSSACLVLA